MNAIVHPKNIDVRSNNVKNSSVVAAVIVAGKLPIKIIVKTTNHFIMRLLC